MSIDRYFKGNFAIFFTDYKTQSITFIYDYAMWRASQENRNIIVFCTTREKEEEWKKLIECYDFKTLTICREESNCFEYLYDLNTCYIDGVHLQNLVIIDGAYDLYFRMNQYIRNRTDSKDDPYELLNVMDDCPENKVFLIAEAGKEEVSRESLDLLYPGLIEHGDAVLGIVQKGRCTDIIPFAQGGVHKWKIQRKSRKN